MPTTKTATDKERNLGPALGYDENFGQLDLSGCPSVRPLSKNTSWIDERFAPLDDRGKSSGLKEFIEEQTAEKEKPSVVHVAGQPFKVHISDGIWHGEGVLNGQRRRLTAPDKDRLMAKFVDLAKQNAIRELTSDEELHIQRLAQSGDESAAFGQYFLSRIGPHVASMEDPLTELLSDPRYRSVCDEAAFFVWAAQTDTYVPDTAFEEMVFRTAQSKPLSGRLITSIWIQYLDENHKEDRQALLNPLYNAERETEPTPDPKAIRQSLEDSSDSEIDKIMLATKREYARDVRAGLR